jgi:hypothetical protein
VQDFYRDAFFIQTERVLGVNLRPLTLGHVWVLECAESPFATGYKGGEIGLDDLVFAVWVCRQKWADLQKYIVDGLPKSLHRQAFIWGIKQRFARTRFDIEFSNFEQYISFHCQGPARWNDNDRGEFRAPGNLGLAWRLMGKQLTPAALTGAMDTPVRHALVFATVEGAINGDDTLKTENEAAITPEVFTDLYKRFAPDMLERFDNGV